MKGNAALSSVDVQAQKYLTLLELSKAIASHRDLTELFHDIACRLRNLFPFRDLAVMLHDGQENVMRSYFYEGCEEADWATKKPTEVAIDESINGQVWRDQQPIIIRDLDRDTRFPTAQILRDKNIKSVCCLPLSTVHQKLGTLNLWSEEAGAYDTFDLKFAQLVTSQIAVAVEAQFYREQLAHERDRSQLLLTVNNTLVSNLNLRELLKSISGSLGAVMPHEAAALTLYDESLNQLRVAAFDFPDHDSPCATGKIIPFEGNPIGEAFTTRKTTLIDYDPANCSGLASGCASPLIFRDRVLGVLGIKSSRPHAFSQDDAELFEQVANQVAIAVENALAYNEIETLKNKLEKEKLYLEEEIRSEYNFEEIVGSSSVLKRALQNVQTVATTGSTVLIYGETGTGKELIARAIHNLSERRKRTLVKVNCAAIPTGLLESELFGHEKGAFTGAIDRRIGRFELAHQGTIFLDEVEDIPLDLQSKLLRVLQEQEFERLGSSRTMRVDVRVVAATNADLAQMVEEKKFRSDLYYRLNVFPINVPPQSGPVVLVGHSYGGAVITKAGLGASNVKALVYVAAFAPDADENLQALLEKYPSKIGGALVPDAAGFLYIDRGKFKEVFAADVSERDLSVLSAAQKPINSQTFGQAYGAPAWKKIPSWYLVANEDQAINPELQRMFAQRMNATTRDVKSSHVPFVSNPEAVVSIITEAADATSERASAVQA